jgi:alkanesulfonate monooxygenase SsuD/methylene tetrahydromethanopterin reductase-like flavin-dependent oxidoreductase (luciferase family)
MSEPLPNLDRDAPMSEVASTAAAQPMHVADEAATLDVLAGGNILGVGLVARAAAAAGAELDPAS